MFALLKKIRSEFWTQFCRKKCKTVGKRLRCNAYCKFTAATEIGDCCNFNGLKISGKGRVVIGNYFHSGQQCMFLTENHNYEGELIPYDGTYITKEIIIGECVWIGSRVMILGGVHIGEGAIIQAGAVVVRDIPPYAIAGGNPATVFKYRDKEHFMMLKEEGKFN